MQETVALLLEMGKSKVKQVFGENQEFFFGHVILMMPKDTRFILARKSGLERLSRTPDIMPIFLCFEFL